MHFQEHFSQLTSHHGALEIRNIIIHKELGRIGQMKEFYHLHIRDLVMHNYAVVWCIRLLV